MQHSFETHNMIIKLKDPDGIYHYFMRWSDSGQPVFTQEENQARVFDRANDRLINLKWVKTMTRIYNRPLYHSLGIKNAI